MGAIKVQKFLGTAPKISAELLPETVASYSFNTKLYSGDLIPYNGSSAQASLSKQGVPLSIYPMDDGAGGFKWLHWITDVDVAQAPIPNNTTQRIYYTGDSEPRVTDFSLATTGATTDYPLAYYTLGLPTPLVAPTVAAVSFASKTTASRARDSGNVATVITSSAHGLRTGMYVTLTGLGSTGYNLANVQVTVIDTTKFSYYSVGALEATTADTGGTVNIAGTTQSRTYVYTWLTAWGEESTPSPVSNTIYLKEGQQVDITALPAAWPGTYTGVFQTTGMKVRIYRTLSSASGTSYFKVGDVDLGTTIFTDDIDIATIVTALPSTDYDQPDPQMIGLLAIHNNMMIGFFGNTLCFCEPGQPHAWPIKYRINLDAPIVALGNFGTSIIVGTTKRPWLIQGGTPTNMSKVKMDYVLPCVSKRSMVNLGFGVAYASRGGLAVYSSQTGGTLLTQYVHDWDTWRDKVDAASMVGAFYNGKYFGHHSKGSFIFQRDDQVGGYLVDVDQAFTAAYYDINASKFYYASNGKVWLWDDPTQPFLTMKWKSKVIVTKDYMNPGAARIIADYAATPDDILIQQENTARLAANANLIATKRTGGPFGGSAFNTVTIAGSKIKPLIPGSAGVTFELFVNKESIFVTNVSDVEIFRLPTGYRSDTFEVAVTSNRRIRAIHFGETPYGLKQA